MPLYTRHPLDRRLGGPRAGIEVLKKIISCVCQTSKDGSSVAKSLFQLLYQLHYLRSLLFTKTGNCKERKHVDYLGADVMAHITLTDTNATKDPFLSVT